MQSYMEMIYIDTGRNARKTNVGAVMDTNAQTWAAFRSAKRLAVTIEDAEYLLDYYNAAGDLSDTIPLNRMGFEQITGEAANTDFEYRRLDNDFWSKQKEKHEARKTA